MNENKGYRVVKTERDKTTRVEVFVTMWPPVNEHGVDRGRAIQHLDYVLKYWTAIRGTFFDDPSVSEDLLPTGSGRLKVVTDEQAHEMATARQLAEVSR